MNRRVLSKLLVVTLIAVVVAAAGHYPFFVNAESRIAIGAFAGLAAVSPRA